MRGGSEDKRSVLDWGGGAVIYKTLLTFLAVITPQTKEGESQILRQLGVRQNRCLSLSLFS